MIRLIFFKLRINLIPNINYYLEILKIVYLYISVTINYTFLYLSLLFNVNDIKRYPE